MRADRLHDEGPRAAARGPSSWRLVERPLLALVEVDVLAG